MPKRVNILIIEDYAGEVILCRTALRRINPRCMFSVCHDTEVALQHIIDNAGTREKPHLIIIDSNLPSLNWFPLFSKIHEMPQYAETPVVLFSCVDEKIDMKKYPDTGAAVHIIKPPRLLEYYSAVKTMYDLALKAELRRVGMRSYNSSLAAKAI